MYIYAINLTCNMPPPTKRVTSNKLLLLIVICQYIKNSEVRSGIANVFRIFRRILSKVRCIILPRNTNIFVCTSCITFAIILYLWQCVYGTNHLNWIFYQLAITRLAGT